MPNKSYTNENTRQQAEMSKIYANEHIPKRTLINAKPRIIHYSYPPLTATSKTQVSLVVQLKTLQHVAVEKKNPYIIHHGDETFKH